MSKHRPARAVLAGMAVVALAGCTGVPTGARPDVPGAGGSTATAGGSSSAAGSNTQVSGKAPITASPGVEALRFSRSRARSNRTASWSNR